MVPLYVYFPYEYWDEIRLAEKQNDEGNKVFEKYSKIYKENFLRETQDDKKIFINHKGIVPKNHQYNTSLSEKDIEALTLNQL